MACESSGGGELTVALSDRGAVDAGIDLMGFKCFALTMQNTCLVMLEALVHEGKSS
ncbi:MAG TPA: hypothetical protein IGS53_21465 [Leptolyngbyaceae cyanobacterium M33_DOE_097]|nr:hypothetical protein [Leptolyngbyaceae cyanobacterium M33_DOE_097]